MLAAETKITGPKRLALTSPQKDDGYRRKIHGIVECRRSAFGGMEKLNIGHPVSSIQHRPGVPTLYFLPERRDKQIYETLESTQSTESTQQAQSTENLQFTKLP